MKIFALGSFFMILTFVLSKISLYLLHKFKIVDIPNPRGMHLKPIPRGGGISILISLIIYFVFIHGSFSFNNYIYAYISLVCISILGFIDDLKSINFKIRLILQFIFSILIIHSFSLDSLYELIDPNLLLVMYLILIIFIVWQINLFNFMDGINGICTLQAILFFLLMSLITFSNEHYYFSQKYLIFGCIFIGFLPLNFPKALVFLGDCGSYLLGALIAYSTIEVLYLGVEFFLIGIILMSTFYLDATITLLLRMIRGEKFFDAHKEHLYQLMTRLSKSHSKTVIFFVIINIAVTSIAYLYIFILKVNPIFFSIIIFCILFVCYILFKKKIYREVLQKNL